MQIETCFNGGRLLKCLFYLFWLIHIIMFSAGESQGVLIAANVILSLGWIYQYYWWSRLGQSDMSDFKLHGDFNVGFKRIDASMGNRVMVFYPVNKSVNPTEMHAYEKPEDYAIGLKGNPKLMMHSGICKARTIT